MGISAGAQVYLDLGGRNGHPHSHSGTPKGGLINDKERRGTSVDCSLEEKFCDTAMKTFSIGQETKMRARGNLALRAAIRLKDNAELCSYSMELHRMGAIPNFGPLRPVISAYGAVAVTNWGNITL